VKLTFPALFGAVFLDLLSHKINITTGEMDTGLIVSRLRNRLLRLPDRIGLIGKFLSIKSAKRRAKRHSVAFTFNRIDYSSLQQVQ
jgi:hypothetical protein